MEVSVLMDLEWAYPKWMLYFMENPMKMITRGTPILVNRHMFLIQCSHGNASNTRFLESSVTFLESSMTTVPLDVTMISTTTSIVMELTSP